MNSDIGHILKHTGFSNMILVLRVLTSVNV